MTLQGTIDAAVNGGIAKYQEAFFKPDYIVAFPNFVDHVQLLKSSIAEQVRLEYLFYGFIYFCSSNSL